VISEAYRAFYSYSTGNQLLAIYQCYERGLRPGPINTYPGWQKLGRHVKKGEKAITLCMPMVKKRRKNEEELRTEYVAEGESGTGPTEEKDKPYTLFVYRPHWFVLSQTEGDDVNFPELPKWDKGLALAILDIEEVPFECMDGNVLGYARKREVAVSPLSPFLYKTLFHEVGHVELGHTSEADFTDGEFTPRSIKEAEAESVALICSESLGLEGAETCRAYVQSWLKGEKIPDKSASKIFAAADRMLKAGNANQNEKNS
jgi:antirestriction protein ArdC